jgi:type II secretory pathway pseudopilin PulG
VRRRVSGDRGETLLELLVAVTIMGITVVAIVGGLGTAIHVSDIHRKQASAGAYVRDYAEAIENAVATGGYVACATTADYLAYGPPGFLLDPADPSRLVDTGATYRAHVVSVEYWTGSSWPNPPTGCSTDTGLQRVTVEVHSTDDRAQEELVVFLRKPCKAAQCA